MKTAILACLMIPLLFGCNKESDKEGCDIQSTQSANAGKITITNGLWGTISSMEGDCMPVVPPSPSSCTHCPVQRTIKVFQYTLQSNATGTAPFYDSFNSPLVAEVTTDADGFFQVNIPAGNYSIAIVENGKLYANTTDGQGGLCPVSLSGGLQNINIAMTYKAVF